MTIAIATVELRIPVDNTHACKLFYIVSYSHRADYDIIHVAIGTYIYIFTPQSF